MRGRTGPQLLERGSELRELGSVFEDVLASHGRLSVVEGAAGAGKSALGAAACEGAADAGLRVLRARGSELEREYAFGAMRQLFEPVLAAATMEARGRLLDGAAGPAEWVLVPDRAAHSQRAMAAFAVLNAFYWLTVNLACDQAILLVLDDAHWVDASSLRALNFMAGRIGDAPIGLLATVRPSEPGASAQLLDELRAHPDAHRITLGPLHARSVARIVRRRIPHADDALCDACHIASAGNPLYLEELLRTVTGNGLLTDSDPAAVVREAAVPSLGDRVMRRISAVAPEAPALATAMAVLGDGGRMALAAALAGLEPALAGRVGHRLRRIEILAAEDPFSFVHPLVRRSVYDHLSEGERRSAHARAARLLRDAGAAAETVATHLAALPPTGSTRTATTLVEAGDSALTRAAPDEAVRWFQRALEENASPPPGAILARLGTTQVALGDKTAIGHLQTALEQADDPGLRSRVAVALADILALSGQWTGAMAVISRVWEEVSDDPETRAELAAIGVMVTAYAPPGCADLGLDRDELAKLSDGAGWGRCALAAMLAALAAHRGEGAGRVRALVERALDGGRLLGERGAGSWAAAHLLIALTEIDDYEWTLRLSDEISAAARRDGSTNMRFVSASYRGWVYARQGDLAAAEAQLRPAVEMGLVLGTPTATATQLFLLQDAVLERPSLDDVAELVETLELEPGLAASWTGAMFATVRGRLRIAGRDHERGIEDLRVSVELAIALKMGPAVCPSRSLLALALPVEERQAAMELVADELELARASGLARPQGVALRAAGILEAGDAGIALLRQALTLLETSPARLEHARTLVELGSALRRTQRRADARPYLEEGMERARRCRAERLLARAYEELRATGARPRRIARSGRDALTASELRVARLAADGASNPHIAQELYISLKTVETHLSHVYAKLGLSGQGSRGRLPGTLDADGLPAGA